MSFIKKDLNQVVETGQHALVSSSKIKYCLLILKGKNVAQLVIREVKEDTDKIINKSVIISDNITYKELLLFINIPINLKVYKAENLIPINSYETVLLEVKNEWNKFSINFPQSDKKKPLHTLPMFSYFTAGRHIYVKDKIEKIGSFKSVLAKRIEGESYSNETYMFGYGQKVKQIQPPYGARV